MYPTQTTYKSYHIDNHRKRLCVNNAERKKVIRTSLEAKVGARVYNKGDVYPAASSPLRV